MILILDTNLWIKFKPERFNKFFQAPYSCFDMTDFEIDLDNILVKTKLGILLRIIFNHFFQTEISTKLSLFILFSYNFAIFTCLHKYIAVQSYLLVTNLKFAEKAKVRILLAFDIKIPNCIS